jgi:galactose-1-phosphate uridylyltransferase
MTVLTTDESNSHRMDEYCTFCESNSDETPQSWENACGNCAETMLYPLSPLFLTLFHSCLQE